MSPSRTRQGSRKSPYTSPPSEDLKTPTSSRSSTRPSPSKDRTALNPGSGPPRLRQSSSPMTAHKSTKSPASKSHASLPPLAEPVGRRTRSRTKAAADSLSDYPKSTSSHVEVAEASLTDSFYGHPGNKSYVEEEGGAADTFYVHPNSISHAGSAGVSLTEGFYGRPGCKSYVEVEEGASDSFCGHPNSTFHAESAGATGNKKSGIAPTEDSAANVESSRTSTLTMSGFSTKTPARFISSNTPTTTITDQPRARVQDRPTVYGSGPIQIRAIRPFHKPRPSSSPVSSFIDDVLSRPVVSPKQEAKGNEPPWVRLLEMQQNPRNEVELVKINGLHVGVTTARECKHRFVRGPNMYEHPMCPVCRMNSWLLERDNMRSRIARSGTTIFKEQATHPQNVAEVVAAMAGRATKYISTPKASLKRKRDDFTANYECSHSWNGLKVQIANMITHFEEMKECELEYDRRELVALMGNAGGMDTTAQMALEIYENEPEERMYLVGDPVAPKDKDAKDSAEHVRGGDDLEERPARRRKLANGGHISYNRVAQVSATHVILPPGCEKDTTVPGFTMGNNIDDPSTLPLASAELGKLTPFRTRPQYKHTGVKARADGKGVVLDKPVEILALDQGKHYQPGPWKSPKGFEKAETSWMNYTWNEMEEDFLGHEDEMDTSGDEEETDSSGDELGTDVDPSPAIIDPPARAAPSSFLGSVYDAIQKCYTPILTVFSGN